MESFLSGSQQGFIVDHEFERDSSVPVAAHSTRGVGIDSIELIHQRFQDIRTEGITILLVSSRLDEAQELSGRTAVMYEGPVVGTINPDDVTEKELSLPMAGRARDNTEHTARGAEGDA